MTDMYNQVLLEDKTLGEILAINISIPDYQRIYCWKENSVYQLLDDILEIKDDRLYHLGNIILHHKDNKYHIVDGQQRLITLTLILQELGFPDSKNPLLYESVLSSKAREYIAYNKYLIKNYVSKLTEESRKYYLQLIKDCILFSVLIVTCNSLDLAYTFFSNQNSKGVPLSDYSLLKAHHLRYIHDEKQAKHLAQKWDYLLTTNAFIDSNDNIERVLGIYLFRLRKWKRKHSWNEMSKHRVKLEFEAAPIMPKLAPFGEKFDFYEKIQGGSHFFAYADHFMSQYDVFSKIKCVQTLHEQLQKESHWWYRDCIEALLFGYYIKFGQAYFTEALICIESVISSHRYKVNRTMLYSVLEHARESEIVMMIDQSTSPTFFFAEIIDKIKKMPIHNVENSPIKNRYKHYISNIYSQIKEGEVFINEIKAIINVK